MITSRKVIMLTAVLSAFAAGLSWNGGGDVGNGIFSEAQARVGRPLTPMSYAGVARRTTRRAVTAGAVAAGAAYAAPVVVAPAPVVVAPAPVAPARCVQAVDPYGRIYTRCY